MDTLTMEPLRRGGLVARLGCGARDLERAQRLRHLAFIAARPGARPRPSGRDVCTFDGPARHVLVEEAGTGALVSCFRVLPLEGAAQVHRSYAAQRYDLAALARLDGPMLEMGRFCIHPRRAGDPDVPRLAWAALARLIDGARVRFVFGCTSFAGAEPGRHRDALALLAARHLAPPRWRPGVKAAQVVPLVARTAGPAPDPRRAARGLPGLLRSYLAMGGRVSDHAVVDRDLDTLHVFTGLEVAAIPPARARLLRAVAA